jgi:hypothetical protein
MLVPLFLDTATTAARVLALREIRIEIAGYPETLRIA